MVLKTRKGVKEMLFAEDDRRYMQKSTFTTNTYMSNSASIKQSFSRKKPASIREFSSE